MSKWNKYNKNIIGKPLDKSTFIHRGTHIPKEYEIFFGVKDISFDESFFITLKYEDQYFKAKFKRTGKTNKNKSLIRLFWSDDLKNVMCKELSEYYNQLVNNEMSKYPPEMCFIKTKKENEYEIAFIGCN
jgi:5-methylcytosine-specific restriction enzyme A